MCRVAPFAGAWIEISHLSLDLSQSSVAPFAGAWIEIYYILVELYKAMRRSLRGSVD